MNKNDNIGQWNAFFRGRPTDSIKKLDGSGDSIDKIQFAGDCSPLLAAGEGRRTRVAVIGTRDPSPYGLAMTEKIVEALSKNPTRPIIVSGLAYGVDTRAHRAALNNGLGTVAVMATGLDTVYPSLNRRLAEEMVRTPDCCLMTQFPNGTAPMAINFLSRNAVIAAMSDLVIVIESKSKGGAIVTARFAHDLDVPVLAVPGRIDDVRSEGCLNLISTGIAGMLAHPDTLKTLPL